MKNSASGPDIDRVAGLGLLEIGFGALGDHARIAVIAFARRRLENVAEDRHRRLRVEGVHMRRGRVGHQHHVGFVDRLPAGDRGAVEHQAFGEGLLIDLRHVEGDVLQLAARIGEAKVDIFDLLVLHHFQYRCRRLSAWSCLSRPLGLTVFAF